MKLSEMSDKQLAAVYSSCQNSSYSGTCDGCHLFGQFKCKTQVLSEIARRFKKHVEEME